MGLEGRKQLSAGVRWILACLVIGLAGILAPVGASATEGPVAAYSFDEGEGSVAEDSAGSHDGALKNTDWAKGRYGSALYLDGTADYVEVPDSPALQLTEEFTLEAWVRPDGVEDEGAVISKTAGNNFSYQLFAGSREFAGIPEGYLAYEPWAWDDVEDDGPLVAKTWNHLALTYDGSLQRLYVNGELVDTSVEPTSPAQASVGPLYFGGNEGEEDFKGRIDEIRLYDRALEAGEVAADKGTPIETPSSGPVAAYSFDEGTGEVAEDSAGSHDGDLEYTEWVNGKYGSALYFDGDGDDMVRIANSADLQLREEFTLEAWVRPDSARVEAPVIEKRTPSFYSYKLSAGGETAGLPEGFVADKDFAWGDVNAAKTLTDNAWSHLALTYDGAVLRLYVDGVFAEAEATSPAQASTGALLIGADDAEDAFKGRIDEVRIYDRALDAGEVAADRVTPIQTPQAEPIAAYSFDEGAGNIAHDSAGTHDGEFQGARWSKGKFGSSLQFGGGRNECLTVPDSPELRLSEEFTLEAWVKLEGGDLSQPVIFKEDGEGWYFTYTLFPGAFEEGRQPEGAAAYTPFSSNKVVGAEDLPKGSWSHLAMTYDGADLRLFVDGKVVDTTESWGVIAKEGELRIGCVPKWKDGFTGKIDEVRIYNRALESSELEADKATPVQVPHAEPVAAYSFDEGVGAVAHDSIGNHDGTLKNGAAWTGAGKFGSAVSFDGVNDLITVPASSDLNLSKDFTVEAWVRPDALTPYNAALTKEAGSFHTYALMPEGNNSAPKAEVGKNSTENNTVNGTSKLPLEKWSHLTLTSDGSHLRLYVNGTEVGSTPNTSVYTAEGATQIGGNLVDSEYFDGVVDEVRIYDRALTGAEVRQDKAARVGWSQQNRLVAAYSFDQGSGNVAHDSIGTHDGILKNGTKWITAGKFDSAVSFDGVNDLITVPASSDLNLSKNFTIEAWVNPEALTPYNAVLTKEAGSFHTFELMPEGNHSAPKAEVAKNSSENHSINGVSQLPSKTWSHLALTSNGEHLRLYVNGTQVASVPASTIYTAEGALQIGGNLIDGEYFKGAVDEVRIYNRTLSQPEIAVDTETGVGWDRRTRLIAAYSLNEGSGAFARDSIGDHDGKLKNGAEWRAGRYGSGVHFDGVDDLITVPAAKDLNLSKAFTIETWVRPDALTPYNSVLTKEAGSFHTYALMPEGNNSAPKAEVAKNSTTNNTVNGTGKLPLSNWSHLALTSDGEHLRLYVNGNEVGSTPNTSVYTADGATQIGGNLVDDEYFKGTADEVRIYNRALSQEEILDDREAPIGRLDDEGPPAINTSNFADVWCIPSLTCFAVGNSDASGSDQWQVKRWTWGNGWATQDLAPPAGAAFSRLRGISCASTASCLAVGSYDDDEDEDTWALAAHWDGEDWQQVPVPKPEGAKEAILSGVFCHSGDSCFAVGRYLDSGGVQRSLAMTWNGVKWTIGSVPTPSGGSLPELLDVACVSTSECRAVGSYVNSSSALKSLVVVWNGSSWSVDSAPDPSGATATRLSGIDCVSTICAAAGSYADAEGIQKPLLLWRSSGAWSVASAPNAEGALATELTSVSCVSTTSCTAAGSYKDDRKRLPLVLGLSSGTWSIQSAESADYGAIAVEPTGVSCTSTSTCNIVGSITYGHGALRREFSYYRSEGKWVADKPEPLDRPWVRAMVGAVTSRLADVSCPTGSLSACVSVGTAESGREAEAKRQIGSVGTGTNPSAQSAAPGPSGHVASSLSGVSCTSTSNCWAVGNWHNATEGGRKNFGTRWNGSSWTPVALPVPEAAVGAYSEAVSCGSSSDCLAVGGWIDGEGKERPLAVHWNGSSWSQASPSVPSGAIETRLTDVSCASATKCAAVGGYIDSEGAPHPLALSWDGKAWSTVSVSPPSGGYATQFTAVSCSTGSCFGLGVHIDENGRPVAFATKPATTESMTTWSSVALPISEEVTHAELQGIDCTSASRCLATGRLDKGAGREPWALSWNGSTWSANPISFDATKGTLQPLSVDCVSSSSCALVGYAAPLTRSHRENLFAQISWPAPGEEIGVEEAVGAATTGSMSAASCTQVGGYVCVGVGSASGPLVKHSYTSSISSWSHSESGWKEIDQPTGIADAGGSPTVADLDCYSASACTAVGGSSTAPQISRWNGSTWSKQTASAPAESTAQAIGGISCPTSASCIAAGHYVKGGVEHPLVYRWKEGSWSPESLDLLNLADKRLSDVSCAGASNCVAVGYSELTSSGVIYQWNGTTWASKTVPAISGSSSSELVGVSCTASDQCTAVGSYKVSGTYKEHGLVLRWNGTAWTQQEDSEAAETKSYSAVSCYSRVGCVATATAYGEDPAAVLAWNGDEWSRESTYARGSGTPVLSFSDVSCASALDCVVVGKISGAAETEAALALEPLGEYADGEFTELEEEGEESEELSEFSFDEAQEAQITDLIAHDPVVRQKLGGAKYTLEIGAWTLEKTNEADPLAGAIALVHLERPRDWARFEQWPTVSYFPQPDPTDYGQFLLEFKATEVTELQVHVAAVTDAEGNIVDGEVVGIEPTGLDGAEYELGPEVEILEEPWGD